MKIKPITESTAEGLVIHLVGIHEVVCGMKDGRTYPSSGILTLLENALETITHAATESLGEEKCKLMAIDVVSRMISDVVDDFDIN